MTLTKYNGLSEDRLYSVALTCAEMNDRGCAGACAGCQFNIFNYVSDVRVGSLLKANAFTDYYRRKQATAEYESYKQGQVWGNV